MTRLAIRHPNLPSCLQTWVLVDAHGLPRFWAAVWQSTSGASLAESTLGSHLTAIDRLYKSVEVQTGTDCLDQLIADGNQSVLSSLLQGHFAKLRNYAAQHECNTDSQWTVALDFVRKIFKSLHPGKNNPVEDCAAGLDALYGSLLPSQPKPRARIRALAAGVVEDLYEVADPNSARNPFRTEAGRWRNFALVLLLLHQGLRRGEAAILPCNAIQDGVSLETGEITKWINVIGPQGEDDPRFLRPSLKTRLAQRQIPVSEDVATVIDHYIDNFRGKPNHPYLFSSSRNLPLALPSQNSMVAALSAALSDSAKSDLLAHNLVRQISPHDFRHTCAVVRLSQFVDSGLEMKIALENLRGFFGWAKDSNMPTHYAQAYFEERTKDVWKRKEDERVLFLRQLKKIDGHSGVLDGNSNAGWPQ